MPKLQTRSLLRVLTTCALFCVLALSASYTPVIAQTVNDGEEDALSKLQAVVEQKAKSLESDESLKPEIRSRAEQFLNKAKAALSEAQSFKSKAAEEETALNDLDKDKNTLRLNEKTLQEHAEPSIEFDSGEGKKTLEGILAILHSTEHYLPDFKWGKRFFPRNSTEVDLYLSRLNLCHDAIATRLSDANTTLNALTLTRSQREARVSEINASLATRATDRSALAKAEDLAGNSEDSIIRDASGLLTEARQVRFDLRLASYEAELKNIEARKKLINDRIDYRTRAKQLYESQLRAIDEEIQLMKLDEAERDRKEALDRLAVDPDELKPIVNDWLELAKRRLDGEEGRIGLRTQIQNLTKERDELQRMVPQQVEAFRATKERVEKIGLTNAIGQLLRKELQRLPDVRQYSLRQHSRADMISEASVEEAKLVDLKNQYEGSIEEEVRAYLGDKADDPGLSSRAAGRVRSLRSTRLLVLEDYRTYLELQTELVELEGELVSTVEAHAAFINERVLWIRSAEPVGLDSFQKVSEGALRFFSPTRWEGVGYVLIKDPARNPLTFALAVLAVVFAFWVRRPALRLLESTAKVVTQADAPPYTFTFKALLATIAIALPLAVLALVLGWRIAANLDLLQFDNAQSIASGQALVVVQEFVGNIADTLIIAAGLLFAFSLVRVICRPHGLGEAHFAWNTQTMAFVRRELGWLRILVIAALFIYGPLPLQSTSETAAADSLGRLAYLVSIAGLLVFAHRVFRSESVLMLGLKDKPFGKFADRLGPLWYPLVTILPVVIIGLALTGYYWTAQELGDRIYLSVLLIVTLVMANALVGRWFWVMSKRLAARRARQRRQSRARMAVLTGRHTPESTQGDAEEKDEEITEEDIEAIQEQSRLLRKTTFIVVAVVGLLMVWRDVLPALAFLDEVDLWQRSVEGADGEGISVPVTLGNLIYGIIALVLTYASVKLIPGLLDMLLLRRLKFDRGGRFAVTALLRYLIVLVGVMIALGELGVGWGEVQWLVAGLSVGLGFGLQEIFANFISGVIMLFERPVRVGDTVTVGGTTGTVMNISMRATTVLDWTRKELIIPNKQFITSELVNWSLSDDIVRLTFKVGIAYGSDTRKAEETLLHIAKTHRLVLKDPKPFVVFMAFGDSTLDFELRVFIQGIDDYMRVINEVNRAIDDEFHKAGIEIAFPQRVVHFAKGKEEHPPEAFGPDLPDEGKTKPVQKK